jgi:hypothetical protein
MKPIGNFGRNDVIRIVAVVSVVAFPLMADAQLGFGSKAAKPSSDIAPLAVASAKASTAPADACANQHWPYFSPECLRGSARVEPRLVSLNSEAALRPAAAAPGTAVAPIRAASTHDDAPVAKPKPPVKPKIAAHKRQRPQPSVTYAATSPVGQVSFAGW